jgi:hypothetical protein
MIVGRSEATPYKQQDFKKILEMVLQEIFFIFRKNYNKEWYEKTFHYIDLTSGDAISKNTSPLLFLDRMSYLKDTFKYSAKFVERNKDIYPILKNNIENFLKYDLQIENLNDYLNHNELNILNGRSKEILTSFIIQSRYQPIKYGLIYQDSNGFKEEDWSFLNELSQGLRYMDILWNVNIDIIKRLSPVGINNKSTKRNLESFEKYHGKNMSFYINSLKKEYKYIRKKIHFGKTYKWAMVFGTNFGGYNNYLKKEFYFVNSEEGRKLLYLIDNGKKEDFINYNLTGEI